MGGWEGFVTTDQYVTPVPLASYTLLQLIQRWDKRVFNWKCTCSFIQRPIVLPGYYGNLIPKLSSSHSHDHICLTLPLCFAFECKRALQSLWGTTQERQFLFHTPFTRPRNIQFKSGILVNAQLTIAQLPLSSAN